MLVIDGSTGEGGGQVLRTSLGLSLQTGTPFRLERIRARRRRPGLRQQHLTAVRAATAVGGAEVSGDVLGSAEIVFRPGRVTPGNYHFDVGTAGSTTLVLQTILPALLTAPTPSSVTLEGGTHNPMAPPYDFLELCYLATIERMGPRVEATLERPGFFPAGGGRMRVTVQPTDRLGLLDLVKRVGPPKLRATAMVVGLPTHIARRELRVLAREFDLPESDTLIVESSQGRGPANIVLLVAEGQPVTEVFTGFGEKGVSAEKVAARLAREAREYLSAQVPVGTHLADQLLLPLAIAGGGCFRTLELTRHATTNMETIRKFLDVSFQVSRVSDTVHQVEVR